MISNKRALGFSKKVMAVASAIILTFMFMSFLPVHAAAAETNLVRLNMKSYGNHNATYDARILEIKPQYVIDNPPHGLYGEMYGYNSSSLLQNVASYQSAGIKVIGYITCGYEGAGGGDHYTSKWYSLDMQKKLITNMATLDHVDGVFIDECSDYPNTASKTYLKTLTSLAHSYGLITWGNTGVDQFDEWFFTEGGFDYMQSSESWQGQSLSAVQKKWGSRISVTGFNKNYTVDDAVRLTLDAWNKGLAFCYINTVEYVAIAPWFEQYANSLRTNGETPKPTSAPTMEGDVNLDGYVTTADAMLIARFKSGLLTLTEAQLQCADTNDDGIVSMADAMLISQWLVDPNGSLGVLFKPLWQSPADDSMLKPIPK